MKLWLLQPTFKLLATHNLGHALNVLLCYQRLNLRCLLRLLWHIINAKYDLNVLVTLLFNLLHVLFRCLPQELHVEVSLLILTLLQNVLFLIDLPQPLLCHTPLLLSTSDDGNDDKK